MQTGTSIDNRIFISDGCNSFVYYGGIFDILFLCLFLSVAGIFVTVWYKHRGQNSAPSNQLRHQVVKNEHVELRIREPGEVPPHSGRNATKAPNSEGL
jgi:hypothetical protein